MPELIPDDDLKIINKVQDKVFSSIKPGIAWSDLNILDDVNASKGEIQELGEKIAVNNPELSATILEIAGSVYFGHSLQGGIPDFFEAVMHMGADRIKVLLFSLSLFALDKGPEAKLRAAKSASIGILGRMIAQGMNFKDELVRKIETGGLLSRLGKDIFMKARAEGLDISDELIEKYAATLTSRIVDKLGLDPFIKQAADMSAAEFDEDSLSPAGVIKLAETVTEDSFGKYGKLVLRSPLPDKDNILARTPGDDIRKVFSALGVDEYLEVWEVPTLRQKEAAEKRGRAGLKKG
jgi:hypothetical protein